MTWPEWWEWELELTPHLLKRMDDREFAETDLRVMLEQARGWRADPVAGRWVIESRFRQQPWEIVVEPDRTEKLLVVVTAYPKE